MIALSKASSGYILWNDREPIIETGARISSRTEMEDEAGFFNIEISSDESIGEAKKIPRDFQSEDDFQKARQEWKPKNEVGEVSSYRI
jgi:hypothetical protein